MTLSDLFSWLAYGLPLVVTVAGIFAYRQNAAKSADEIQQRVISALQVENEALTKRVERCEEEAACLREQMETLQSVLKSRGIMVHVDGKIVTVQDEKGVYGTRRTPPSKPPRPAPKKKIDET